ncbi:MAG: hypothetical protein ACXVBW_10635, partial [Bdellovibrionota bacterium]
TSGSTLRLSGRVSLAITVTTVFDGNCTASLQAIAACYQSGGSSCLGSVNPALGTQSDVIGMFGPFFQNGLVTASTLPTFSEIAYSLTYQ